MAAKEECSGGLVLANMFVSPDLSDLPVCVQQSPGDIWRRGHWQNGRWMVAQHLSELHQTMSNENLR